MGANRASGWKRSLIQGGILFAAATAFSVYLAVFYYLRNPTPQGPSFGTLLLHMLSGYWVWVPQVPVIGWLAGRFRLDAAPRLRNWLIHLVAGAAVLLGVIAVYVLLTFSVFHFLEGPTFWQALKRALVVNLPSDLQLYVLIVLGWYAFDWYRKYRDRDVRAAELASSLQQAKLAALKSQLNPHFLFNALNSVSALMHRDVEAADAMLARIGELLRLTLSADSAQEIRLHEELELLERYLDIERIRFADRLAVTMDFPESTLSARVPPFSLQPLVENAIRHGVASSARGGRVTISARQFEDRLQLRVVDDGPGFGVTHPREGVGLRNTRDRLQQLYGEAQQLAFRRPEAGGLEVLVELPWRTR